MRSCVHPSIFVSILLAFSGSPGVAEPVTLTVTDGPESECRSLRFFGCGGVITNEWTRQKVLDGEAREAEAWEAWAKHPEEEQNWRALYEELIARSERQQYAEQFFRQGQWEEPPSGEGDVEAQQGGEKLQLLLKWRDAFPESPEPWIRLAERQSTPEASVERFREALEALPGDQKLTWQLAQSLAQADREVEGLKLLEANLRAFPEMPEAYDSLNSYSYGLEDQEEGKRLREAMAWALADRWPERRLDLVDHYLWGHEEEEGHLQVDSLLDEMLTTTQEPQTLFRVCTSLGEFEEEREELDPRVFACYERVAEALLAREHLFPEEREMLWTAHHELLMRDLHHGDGRIADQVLAESPDYGWLDHWSEYHSLREEAACRRLLAGTSRGQLYERTVPFLAECPRRLRTLLDLLEDCGHEEAISTLVDRLQSEFRELSLDQLFQWTDFAAKGVRAELERRLAAHPTDRRIYLNLASFYGEGETAARHALYQRWALADLGTVEPLFLLSREFYNGARYGDLTRALGEAENRRPDHPDHALAHGLAALVHGDFRAAAAAARRVGHTPQSSKRQRAEASYLLGRVAFEEGRLQEATEHLRTYFSLRLRFDPCFSTIGCDIDYLFHLVATDEVEHLHAYFDLRKVAAEVIAEDPQRTGIGFLYGKETESLKHSFLGDRSVLAPPEKPWAHDKKLLRALLDRLKVP